MVIHMDRDSVRMRVHRRLFAQALPQFPLRCSGRLELSVFDGVPEGTRLVAIVCLEGLTEPQLGSWLTAARGRGFDFEWYALVPRGSTLFDWVDGLGPRGVLYEPFDIHSLKRELLLPFA